MSKPITDEALALLGISNAMQRLTIQLEHLGLATQVASHKLLDIGDVGHKLTQRAFMMEAVLGHANEPSVADIMLGDNAGRRRYGGGGSWGWPGSSGSPGPDGEDGQPGRPGRPGRAGRGGRGGDGGPGGEGYSPRPKHFRDAVGFKGVELSRAGWYGRRAQFDDDKSPEFAASHWTRRLLEHGNTPPELVAALKAHLTGGAAMTAEQREALLGAAKGGSKEFASSEKVLFEAALHEKIKKHADVDIYRDLKEGNIKPENVEAYKKQFALTENEKAHIRRADKARITETEESQLARLVDMADRRREVSQKRMARLSEDHAQLNAPGGVPRLLADRAHAADKLTLQQTSEELARLTPALEAARKRATEVGPAASEQERDRARKLYEKGLADETEAKKRYEDARLGSISPNSGERARKELASAERDLQTVLASPQHPNRLMMRNVKLKAVEEAKKKVALVDDYENTRLARQEYEENLHSTEERYQAHKLLQDTAERYSAAELRRSEYQQKVSDHEERAGRPKGAVQDAGFIRRQTQNLGEWVRGVFRGGSGGGVSGFNKALDEGRSKLEIFGEFLNRSGQASEKLFKRGVLFASSAAEAASPDAFGTLSGSWKLMLASIGESLQPTILQAAAALQALSIRFRTMDDATRSTVGSVIKWGAVLAGGVMLARALGVGQLAAAAMAGRSWLGGASIAGAGARFMLTNPLGVAALTAGGAYLAASTFRRSSPSLEIAARMFEQPRTHVMDLWTGVRHGRQAFRDRVDARTRGELDTQLGEFDEAFRRQVNPSELDSTTEGQHLRRSRPRNPHEFIADQARFRHDMIYGRRVPGSNPLLDLREGGLVQDYLEHVRRGRTAEAEDTLRGILHARQSMLNWENLGRRQRGETIAYGSEALAQRSQTLSTAQGLLHHLESRTQPGFFSPEDIYKKIQLEALQESPLQREIREIQLRMLEQLVANNQSLRELLGDRLARLLAGEGLRPAPARAGP